jgi:putative oxidoreductase
MEYGILLLRLVVGLTLAAHGSQKLFGSFGGGGTAGTRKFFAGLGFRTPLAMAFVAGLSELGGGLLFAFGLLTPFATVALTVVMLNAIGTVHFKKGFFNSGRLRVQRADHRHRAGGHCHRPRSVLARPCSWLDGKDRRSLVGTRNRGARPPDRAGDLDARPRCAVSKRSWRAIHARRAHSG